MRSVSGSAMEENVAFLRDGDSPMVAAGRFRRFPDGVSG
jgi:hypothetical protein